MTAAAWVTLLVTFTLAVILPGPDTFMLLRVGVRDRRAAVLAALGILIGNTVWTVGSLVGLATVLQAVPEALRALQFFGALVLTWMGVQSLRGGVRLWAQRRAVAAHDSTGAGEGAVAPILGRIAGPVTGHPLRLGLITNLSNPKALLFFSALFSQILPADSGWVDRVTILLVLTLIALAWFLCFALLTSSAPFQRWFGRATPVIDIVAGAVFITVAAFILVELALTLLPR